MCFGTCTHAAPAQQMFEMDAFVGVDVLGLALMRGDQVRACCVLYCVTLALYFSLGWSQARGLPAAIV